MNCSKFELTDRALSIALSRFFHQRDGLRSCVSDGIEEPGERTLKFLTHTEGH